MKKNRLTLNCQEMKFGPAAEPTEILLPLPVTNNKRGGQRVKEGRRLKTGELILPGLYSPVTGVVKKVEPFFAGTGQKEAVRIQVSGEDEWDTEIQVIPDFSEVEPLELLAKLNRAGLGFIEAFPTVKNLVVSAVDGDPVHMSLQQLLREEKERVGKALSLMLHLTSAQEVLLAVPEPLLELASQATAGISQVKIFAVKPVHPIGIPGILLKKIAGSYDLSNHLFINLEKVIAALDVLEKGKPAVYKNITLVDEKGTRNLRVRTGTLIKELLKDSGLKDNDKVILGGALKGSASFTAEFPITADVDSVYVQYHTKGQVDKDRNNQCMSCGRCVRVCPVGLDVNLICRYSEFSIFEECIELDVEACVECGLCAYHCPSGRSLVQLIRLAKHEAEKNEEGEEVA